MGRARWALLLCWPALGACGDDAPPALTVGPVSYTDDQLLGLSDSRRSLLADLTAVGLAVADSSGLPLGAPLIEEWADDRLLEILAADLVLEAEGVEDAVLRARYEADPEWELTVHHVLVYSERWRPDEHREAAATKAARAREMLTAGTSFSEVESALAADGGALARQGRLPPGREGAWVPEFWAAALALAPGDVSPVTETQYGFHVLRLEDRRQLPFDQARTRVAAEVAAALGRPSAALEAWTASRGDDAGSRRAAALDEARARGLAVPATDRSALEGRWLDQLGVWAGMLGFTYGATPAAVANAALAALASPGQNANIARGEIAEHSAVMRLRYPVTAGTPGAGAP